MCEGAGHAGIGVLADRCVTQARCDTDCVRPLGTRSGVFGRAPQTSKPYSGRYFAGRGQAIWNNSGGDTAALFNSSNEAVDTYSYSS